jgi:serine protease Do
LTGWRQPPRFNRTAVAAQWRAFFRAPSMPSPFRIPHLPLLAALAACEQRATVTGAFPDFADLVEKVSPSVVNISTVQASADRALEGALPPAGSLPEGAELDEAPEWFKRFLREHADTAPPAEDLAPPDPQDSLGSGFVLWSDGYILTNYHVVRDAREIIVKLLDRRQFTAQLIGSDDRSDLALLKIEAQGLPAVRIGQAGKLRPGEWVFAIGAPFSFDYSVTAGIVSAKGRALQTEQYVPFIQTDVPINPGNSGGPLFNLRGEVVGVNSQIYSQSGGYQGLSFAIPIDVAAKVASQLKDKGRVERGWLGVVVEPVTREVATQSQLERTEGARVTRVMPNSPADQSGLRAGDIILKYNDVVLPGSGELPPLVGATDPGQLATLDVVREGKRLTIKVQLGALDNQDRQAALDDDSAPGLAFGLTVRPLSADERRSANLLSPGGLYVERVAPGLAARAGVRAGDILLQIAGQDIDGVERYAEVTGRLTPGQTVALLLQRRGAPLFLTLDVPVR